VHPCPAGSARCQQSRDWLLHGAAANRSSLADSPGDPGFKNNIGHSRLFNRRQKSETDLDFTEARDSEWQWHQLGHMQVCTSLQTDNHASIPPLRQDALPDAQPTASKH